MLRRPPRATRTDTLFPYTTLFRSDPEASGDTLQIDTFVDDAIEVAEHVRERLGKDKLVLVGHSWGTIVGLRAALERPDLFHAYVGIGQVINTRLNEKLSFEYGLRRASAEGNRSEERRVGNECVSTFRSWWLPDY